MNMGPSVSWLQVQLSRCVSKHRLEGVGVGELHVVVRAACGEGGSRKDAGSYRFKVHLDSLSSLEANAPRADTQQSTRKRAERLEAACAARALLTLPNASSPKRLHTYIPMGE